MQAKDKFEKLMRERMIAFPEKSVIARESQWTIQLAF